MAGDGKTQAKPMTALLNEDNELAAFDASAVPAQLLPVLDVESSAALRVVRVDPLAILKIVKHARESYPTPVNGQLLGLEIGGVLEVTNAFAVPTQPGSDEDMTQYQVEMIQSLREVNVDSSSVGWYQSTRLGDFLQQPLLDVQASYQASAGAASVVLIHDTAKSEHSGNLSLRAFRLTPTYLDLIRRGSGFTTRDVAAHGLTYANILEEVPVHVAASALGRALVAELQWPAGAGTDADADALQRPSSFNAKLRARAQADDAAGGAGSGDAAGGAARLGSRGLARPMCTGALDLAAGGGGSLARQLEAMGELMDEHAHDASQWMYWKRGEAKVRVQRQQFVQRQALANAAREARGEAPEPVPQDAELDRRFAPLPEPSRLDALLNAANLGLLAKGLTQSRGPALAKMYMAQALHGASAGVSE
ncbi:hypothetical protein GGI04_003586 [Coemansia thaxteri]|uniref:MPN domain-containing protein n=1 Tax=Coemansia thaxteri TaxID=2663907 RepID=A0A9W8BHM8_9FUNG|nr:hypothetical protein H4R26_004169 [Coemansia thaxteri]KAJ2001842.1 hypothetical protein GGI04_003586 [Coemansia thaxteri]KAJ2470563.1 hypothetical protein GGI02_002848 [Coemansia sp. RSA 2322]KAJ2475571.1 hypothetical protein EV174_005227 [Coemansia sp. RSA 2320]